MGYTLILRVLQYVNFVLLGKELFSVLVCIMLALLLENTEMKCCWRIDRMVQQLKVPALVAKWSQGIVHVVDVVDILEADDVRIHS